MATIVLLISEAYLKDATVVNENVDVKVIRSNIKLAQDLYIRPALGTRLYDQLLTEVQGNTLTAANDTLLTDYVKPALKFFVQFELGRDLVFKWMNKGIASKNSDNAVSVDLETLKQIREEYKDKAENYLQDLILFIKANVTDYPLYTANTEIDEKQPIGNGYTSPIYLRSNNDYPDTCCDQPIIIY